MAGYQVEYSSTPYLLLMLAEVLQHRPDVRDDLDPVLRRLARAVPEGFLTSWPPILAHLWALAWMLIKIVFWFFMVAMAKAIVPRYRYDQLMRLGWKVFLPTSLAAVVLVAAWRVFGPQA